MDPIFSPEALANNTFTDQILSAGLKGREIQTLAPIFAPLPLNALLLGILTWQVGRYFRAHSQADSRFTKGLVVSLMLLSMATTAAVCAWTFCVFIKFHGHWYPIFESKYIVPLYGFLGMQFTLTSAWYAHKAWRLYQYRWWVPTIIMFFTAVSMVAAIGTMYSLGSVKSILQVRDDIQTRTFACVYIFGTIASDLLITGFILGKLIRSKTGWSQTDALIRKLTILTMESQLPPTIFCLVAAIHFSITFSNELSYPYLMMSGNMYAIALLYSLNSRSSFRDPYEVEKTRNELNTFHDRSRVGEHTQVQINVETHIEVSDMPVLEERKRHAGLRDDDAAEMYELDKFSGNSREYDYDGKERDIILV